MPEASTSPGSASAATRAAHGAGSRRPCRRRGPPLRCGARRESRGRARAPRRGSPWRSERRGRGRRRRRRTRRRWCSARRRGTRRAARARARCAAPEDRASRRRPSSAACRVESTMSVRRIVASTRSGAAARSRSRRNASVSSRSRALPGGVRPGEAVDQPRDLPAESLWDPLRNVGGLPRRRRAVQHERGHADGGKHVGDVAVHDHALERDRCAGLALWRMWRTYQVRNSSSSARVGVYSRSWPAKNSGVPQLSPTSRSQSATRRRFAPTGSPATGDPSATGRKGRAQSSAPDRWRRREWPGASPRVRRGERRTPPPRRPSRHGRRPSAPRASGRFGAGRRGPSRACRRGGRARRTRASPRGARTGAAPRPSRGGRGYRVRRRGRAAPRRAPGRRC